ncbi:3-ketoacyl-CoA synthase-like protein [Medicago truncatula]|uniref:3-ketoacyl-CoA synthase-like protein n=1 Tax=Medicago truncatula TaxID=3880 RepID=G7L0I4_MEDTR|nr:3-ketoacyl-CoA synthase-like protein [Medicago truncatula]
MIKLTIVFLRKKTKKLKLEFHFESNLMAIVGEALKSNIITIGHLVLPVSKQLLFLFTLIEKKIFNYKMKSYVPDSKPFNPFDHT